MKKIIIISFFKSNNLGDVVLSKSLYNIYDDPHTIIKCFDFTTISVSSPQSEITNRSSDSYLTLKGQINRKISRILKSNLYTKIVFVIKRHTTDKKSWLKYSEAIKDVDKIIIGGGNMLMDADPSWPMLISEYIKIAKKNKKNIYISHVGVGPLKSNVSKKLISKLGSSVSGISVRDENSFRELLYSLKFDKEKIIVTADPAFNLEINSETIPSKVQIGINVLSDSCFSNEEIYRNYILQITTIVNDLKKFFQQSQFVLFSTDAIDLKALNDVKNRLNFLDTEVKIFSDLKELEKEYKNFEFILGGRMHAMIFAQKMNIPYIGIYWQEKIKSHFENVNNPYYFRVEELSAKRINLKNILSDLLSKDNIDKMKSTNLHLKDKVQKGIF